MHIEMYLLIKVEKEMWRRSTPVLWPGKSHGQRSLVAYSPCSHKESDMTEWLHFPHFIIYHWIRKWQSTPVFLPGESHGQRSLAGHGPWGHRESDTTEVTEHACTLIKAQRRWVKAKLYWPKEMTPDVKLDTWKE